MISSRTAAGGLIGRVESGGTVRAAYATGSVGRTGTVIVRTHNEFGSAVGESAGTINYVYGSGAVTTSGTEQNPSGTLKQTESALRTPTGYTGIYANWNFDIDNADNDDNLTTGTDDPWEFGNSGQLPVFKYTPVGGTPLPPGDLQPASLTLTAAATTIAEGATTVITATLASAKNYDVRVTQPDGQSRYTYDVTVPEGDTSATTTFTAVNNNGPDDDVTVALTGSKKYPSGSVDISSNSSSITIQDDDIHFVNNVSAVQAKQQDGTYDITVTWDAPNTENIRNATAGYDFEYKTTRDSTWTASTIPDINTVTETITNVSVYRTYEARLRAKSATVQGRYSYASVGVGEDHDTDDDGYIEVFDLAELNAIRYDLDANGAVSSTDEANYLAAFTNAIPGMGCPSTGCVGYELRANLDFNTNDSAASAGNPAGADSGDDYWNGGSGWDPIGGVSGGDYTGSFDGNTHTISNIFIDRTSGNYAGLFADLDGTGQTIENVSLVNVDVTLNVSTSSEVYVGGLAGYVESGVTVEDSYTTGRVRAGESSTDPVTLTASDLNSDVGGLVGRSSGSIVSSYSLADVTAHSKSSQNGIATNVGGLVGRASGGSVSASYAGGAVSGNTVAQNNGRVHAGGLVGHTNGAVSASYARGDVSGDYDAIATASVTGRARVGGLVGWQVGNVTASFSTGRATATGDGTLDAGGLVGRHTGGTNTYSYWDAQTSGIADDSDNNSPEGRSTSLLQAPTGYSGIYANWNVNVDGQGGSDDPWDFGAASQYPTLKYESLVAGDQRATLTLSASPTTIWERALTSHSRVNQATITATLDKPWNEDVVVTFPTNAAYGMSLASTTIAQGATTTTATLTAVNNFVDAANNAVTLAQATHPTDTTWIAKGADVSVTINDDDELAKPIGLRLSVDGTKIQADWTAVTGATGYKVQWHTSDSWASPTGTDTVTGGSTVTHKITSGLSANTKYYVRVLPTKSGADEPPSDAAGITTTASAGTGDYDVDNDGLIDVDSLAKLNAIRWDLDGDGVVDDSSNSTSYATAFPNAEDNMGCNESAVTIASNNTGNPACSGYELSADLDLDTNGSGSADSGDTYWNGGAGWTPMGDDATAFTGKFVGTGHTISNLFINVSSQGAKRMGLFGVIGSGAEVKDVGLADVSVTVAAAPDGTPARVGPLAGENKGTVTGSWATGAVTVETQGGFAFNQAGGLVGFNDTAGAVRASYSKADVTGRAVNNAQAGGLVGRNKGAISASYAVGDVSVTGITNNTLTNGFAGGLVAVNDGAITAAYASGDLSATATNVVTGGLVAESKTSGGSVTASFATGKHTTATDTDPESGGLVGRNTSPASVTNGYWDTQASGITAAGAGTGKTTSELQAPTAYGTGISIYANWNVNVDGVTGNDDPWDFGAASQYPALKFGGLVAGGQRATLTLSVSPATIWERALSSPSRVNSATITATLDKTWHNDVTLALPTDAAYTLGANSLTISAGATTTTTTLTAVNNLVDAANKVVTIASAGGHPNTTWIAIGATAAVTINDDDELTKPTGLRLSVDGTNIQADWTAVTGATGYKVQWNTSDSWTGGITGSATISSGSTVTHKITSGLSANTTYYVRVLPTKSGADEPPSDAAGITTTASAGTGDYDTDNDGLIEVSNLAQLNAMRYDLDGDGVVDDPTDGTATTTYAAAFPNAEDNMGCNESVVTIASNNTGNPPCSGYELSADLDFDDNTAGDRTDDTYHNGGAGWLPIAHDSNSHDSASDPFNTTFEGNGHVISNLFIDRRGTRTGASGSYRYQLFAGLFGSLGSGAKIRNLGVEDVSVTFKNYTASIPNAPEVYAGGLAGYGAGEIFKTHVTGAVSAIVETSTNTDKHPHAGGLVGRQVGGSITSSYARVAVTANQDSNDANSKSYAGGLAAYQDGGDVAAAYARGSVTAVVRSSSNGEANAGGLIGYHKNGEIKSSYSEADATATAGGSGANPTLNAGGFVGTQDGGKITASYSTGMATSTTTSTPSNVTRNVGGLTGRYVSGATTNSYWDTTTSGITAAGQGTGKTTAQLKGPTSYTSTTNNGGTAIFTDWELDLDNADGDNDDATGKDDQWNFGTSADYPVLQHHLAIPPQRASVTLTVSPATIWERALTTPSRVNQTTITATLSGPWHHDVTVTPALDDTAYTLNPAAMTVAQGATTTTATLTAVNNFTCGTSDCPSAKVNKSVSLTAASDDPWVSVGATPSLTINDDDELAKPTGLKLAVDGTKIKVEWAQVTSATGYKVQWHTSDSWASPTGTQTITSGSTLTHTISSGLSADTTYYVRVLATKGGGVDDAPSDAVSATTRTSAGTGDYDADNDGLIEVSNLAQLNAMRWDLDGDGAVDASANATAYATAFPNAEDNMGCNESVVTIASNNTGNPPCSGYELRANLDFDTNSSGGPNSGDTYWNGGAGWTPIGDGTTPFTGDFDGNNDSDASGDGGPYAIANLYVKATSTSGTSYAGLFGVIGAGSTVKNVALTGVSVEGSTSADAVYVGALAGRNQGAITGSWSLGAVAAHRTGTGVDKDAYAGGLVGRNNGVIRAAYSRADVTATAHNANEAHAGGLVGLNDTGATTTASYAAGDATANRGTDTGGSIFNKAYAGGLAAVNDGAIIASYATGDATGAGRNADAGGLVAINASGATITAGYSLGAPSGTATGGTANVGGFAGSNAGTVTSSYWATTTSGVADDAGSASPEGKTTSDLQAPTTETGIYASWDVDVDGDGTSDDPWDFGTASQYPVLDFGGQAVSKQRATATVTAAPTTIWERADTGLSRVTESVITATLSGAWEDDLTVTLPSAVAGLYTLGASTLSLPAGSLTATTKLTAVDDTVDQTSPDSRSLSIASTTIDSHVVALTVSDPTITISDDDNVPKVTGVKLTADGTKIRADWTAAAGATGYRVEWHTAASWTGSVASSTVSGGSTTNYTISPTPALSANTRYYVRVVAVRTGELDAPPSDAANTRTTTATPGTGDYDADNDGLIEVSNLAQLNAIRYDLDGDGAVDDSANAASYATAFPNAEDNMGCNESVVSLASNDTGNPPCTGYELTANLDFDDNTAGDRTDDTYHNSGAGWDPIASASTAFTARFVGTGYTISNLLIDRDATKTGGKHYAGLFGWIDVGSSIEGVTLTGVSVTLENTAADNPQPNVYAGGLVGRQKAGTISGSGVVGSVKAVVNASTHTTNPAYAGGLVGYKEAGNIISGYARATVTSEQNAATGSLNAHAGGLVGYHKAGGLLAVYSAGAVSAKVSNNNGNAYAGGLVGEHKGGEIKAAYSYASTTAANSGGSNTSVSLYAAGLVAYQNGGNVTAAYSTGAPTIDKGGATSGVTEYRGGLVGRNSGGSTTDGYWDTESSGIDATGQGTGKTRSQLRTPTAYGTETDDIYKDWDIDLDTTTAGTQDPWDFGTASQYPVLKYGLSTTTQRVVATLSAAPTTIWERALSASQVPGNTARVNAATITATLGETLLNAVAITLTTTDDYTLSSEAVTIAAGSLTGTTTLTAVNNRVDAANNAVNLATGAIADDPRVGITSADPTLTINDDDSLTAPANLDASEGSDHTSLDVSWSPVANAGSYKMQHKLSTDTTWGPAGTTPTTACTGTPVKCKNTIPGLIHGKLYHVRVWAVGGAASGIDESPYANLTAGPGVDYDTDDDGMIEVSSLAQLNAIRYDLDGDGVPETATSTYKRRLPRRPPQAGLRGEPARQLPQRRRLRAAGQPGLQHQQQRQVEHQPHRRRLRRRLLEQRQRLAAHRHGELQPLRRHSVHHQFRRQQRHRLDRGRRPVHHQQPVHKPHDRQLRRPVRLSEQPQRQSSGVRGPGERGRHPWTSAAAQAQPMPFTSAP